MTHRSVRRVFGLASPGYLALVVAAVILTVSLLPPGDVGSAPGSDKLHHVAAYGLLAFLALFGRRTFAGWSTNVALILAFGGAIEVVQPQFGRAFEWADMMSNAIGVAVGAVLVLAAGKMRRTDQRH